MTEKLDAGLAHATAGPEHKLERLVFFSDAVFAIAITLLVIELHPPHLPLSAGARDYAHALFALGPAVMGVAISFFVIAAFWAGHHRAFALARRWDDRLMMPNILMLFAVASMPFVTGFMSANPLGRVPAMLYVTWLLLLALANVRMQRLATSPPVVDPAIGRREVMVVRRRGQAVAVAATVTLIAVALAPYPAMGLALLASIPLWRRAITRWLDDRAGPGG